MNGYANRKGKALKRVKMKAKNITPRNSASQEMRGRRHCKKARKKGSERMERRKNWLPAPARRVLSARRLCGHARLFAYEAYMRAPDNNITRPSRCSRVPHYPTSNLSHKAQSRTGRPVNKASKNCENNRPISQVASVQAEYLG